MPKNRTCTRIILRRCIATASARCLVRQQPGQVPGGNSPHYTSQMVAVEEVVDKSEERIILWNFVIFSKHSKHWASCLHVQLQKRSNEQSKTRWLAYWFVWQVLGSYLWHSILWICWTIDYASMCSFGGLGVHICGQLSRCGHSSDARATCWASAKIKLPPRAGRCCQWQRGRWFRECLPWFAMWIGRAGQVRMIGQV